MHPDLPYVALRPNDANQPAQHIVIVARDRIEAVKGLVGPVDIIAEFQGDASRNSYSPHLFTMPNRF